MPRKSKHVHKLKRHNFKNGEAVFFCASDCRFKINASLALGKITECWRCGKAFELDEYALRLTKPHCRECTRRKVNISIDDILDVDRALILPKLPDYDETNNRKSDETSEEKSTNQLFEDLSSRLSSAIHKIPMLAGRKNEESISEDEDDLL